MSGQASGSSGTIGMNFPAPAPAPPPDPAELARNRQDMIKNFSWPHTFGQNSLSDADGAAWMAQHPDEERNWKKLHPGNP